MGLDNAGLRGILGIAVSGPQDAAGPLDRGRPAGPREQDMTKGEQRSNKEVRKPKAEKNKKPAAGATKPAGSATPIIAPAKKK